MNLCDSCSVTTKRCYIPQQRRELENNFGKQAINEVFGKPTELEEIEILLLETEEPQIMLLDKYDNLIKLTHKISIICLDFSTIITWKHDVESMFSWAREFRFLKLSLKFLANFFARSII